MIRILIVDDSAVLRQTLRFILQSDTELQVVGEASNGIDAVQQVAALMPDVVTMDINMPKMDGLGAIREIMAEHPVPIVVVTSMNLDQEMGLTTQATKLGAVSVLIRPSGIASPKYKEFAAKLIAQIKLMSAVKVIRHKNILAARTAPPVPPPLVRPEVAQQKIELVAIGSSTGGPAALHDILAALPATFPVPILIVQHISFGFVGGLATWLNDASALHVQTGAQGQKIQPGNVYIAPDSAHMIVDRFGKIALTQTDLVGGFRPSVTPLFESVARVYGPMALGVILTGMGSDGAVGMRALAQAGAITIAQNEASCVVFGMPKEAIALGGVKHIVPLHKIAGTMTDLCAVQEK